MLKAAPKSACAVHYLTLALFVRITLTAGGETSSSRVLGDVTTMNRVYMEPVSGRNESFLVFVPPATRSKVDENGVPPALVSFAHGAFLLPELYEWFGHSVAATGRVVVMARVPGIPDSRRLALAAAAGFLGAREEAKAPSSESSPLAGIVGDIWVAAGHSLGGGTSFLSADAHIIGVPEEGETGGKTGSTPLPAGLLTLSAGAWTLPPATTSAARIVNGTPALLLTGSEDCIDPPENNSLKLYNALYGTNLGLGEKEQSNYDNDGKGNCKGVVSIMGGCHCNFASFNAGCSVTQTRCGAKGCMRLREGQQATTQALLTPWLDLVEQTVVAKATGEWERSESKELLRATFRSGSSSFATVLDELVANGAVSILAQDWGGCAVY